MTEEKHRAPSPWFGDKVYNYMKFVALILLPAVATLYTSIAGLWGLPNVQEIVGTIVAVDTFLGILLGISSAQYRASDAAYDGVMEVYPPSPETGRQNVQLALNDGPENLISKDLVSFKVHQVVDDVSTTPGDLPPVAPISD